MARIPLGNFGNAIADAAPRVNIPAGAFDNGGRALQQAGETGMQVATEMQREEFRVAEQKRIEDLQLTRARAANTVLDRELAVKTTADELQQDIATGKVNYNDAPAEYQIRLKALPELDLTGLDPVTAEHVQKGFKRADFQGETSLQGAVRTARVADFKTQADGILDKLGKQAGMPGADVNALNAKVDALDEVGTQAYGAAWAKRKQDWKDNNWNDQLGQQAIAVRDDLKGITDLQQRIASGDLADKLDSNKRNTLVARLDGYRTSLIQRNEAAAARAERAQERHLKQAEAEFNVFSTMADKGTIIAPEYIDKAMKLTAGTPYQAGVIAMARQAQDTGGLASQPLVKQQALLDQVDAQIAKQGRTPELDKRRTQIEKVLNGSKTDLKENGLRAGLERGVITDLAPLDVSTPEAMAKSIVTRLDQAKTVSLWAGKSVSPLDAREADTFKTMLDNLPAKQKSMAVSTIAEAVGPKFAGAIAEQLDHKDKPLSLAFATAGAQTTADRFTSELILKGATALKDGAVMKDDKKVTGWKATIASQVNGAFSDENTAGKVKEAAWYIAAGIAAENGGSVSTSDLERSVRLAVGGNIIERNGKKLPIPAGMDEAGLDKRLKAVSEGDILKQAPGGKVRVGGVDMAAADFAKSIPGQELLYAGPGKYVVVVRGRPVVNAAGRSIVIAVQ